MIPFINVTGIRNLEFITSSPKAKQNKGTIIQIKGYYNPHNFELEDLFIRDQIKKFEFFKDKSINEIRDYLLNISIPENDLYLEDTPIEIKFIKIGGDFFIKSLTSEQINFLLNSDFLPINTVYNMFPRKPGSKARKHTLIFRPSNWILMNQTDKLQEFNGYIININTTTKFGLEKINEDIAIKYDTESIIKKEEAYDILNKIISSNIILEIKEIISWFSPSIYKSLLQKIIRTRTKYVVHMQNKYKAVDVLLVVFTELLFHHGAFVPNIQRYVNGCESALKRLAVSICEDSYTENYDTIVELYAGAFIAQKNNIWKPSVKLYKKFIDLAIETQKENKIFKYNWREVNKKKIKKYNCYNLAYILLENLKSFQSDIDMLYSIYENMGISENFVSNKRFKNMDITHCIDHHSLTEIAWYIPYMNLEYENLFKFIWNNNVGINPRREKYQNWMLNENVIIGQKRVWKAHTHNLIPRILTDKQKKFKYNLNISTLAGLIGPIEIKLGNINAIAVLKTNNIYEYTIVRNPGRIKREELTDNEKIEIEKKVIKLLTSGYKLKKIPKTLKEFEGLTVTLKNGKYYLNDEKWTDLVKIRKNVSFHENIESNIDNALNFTGIGIQNNKDIGEYDSKVLKRLSTYLEGYKPIIELFQIGRDGKGVNYTVSKYDTLCFEILCKLCCIYPAALEFSTKGFIVKDTALFWKIKEKIYNVDVNFKNKWTYEVVNERKLYEHQKNAVDEMIDKILDHKRGHLIWQPVGSGKTLIVLSFIKYLIDENKMPKYCVYSLPPSAVTSIIKEIENFNIPYNLIDARLSSTAEEKIIKKYTINLIWHDHMRMNGLDEQLREKSSEMLFIVDEFHKTLGNSQRTSLALEISKLSYDFIGLSGTIVNTDNPKELIQWLELIVEFEVTTDNYMVAVGALISSKFETGVKIKRKDKMIEFIDNDEINSENFRDKCNLAYELIIPEMIKLSVKYYKKNIPVFIVAKGNEEQILIKNLLINEGYGENEIFLIEKDKTLEYSGNDTRNIMAVITTPNHSTGYTLTKIHIMITSVYFGNQSTRTQLEGRLNRIGQKNTIKIYTLHAGVLSYVFKKYEHARSIAEVLKEFAKNIDPK